MSNKTQRQKTLEYMASTTVEMPRKRIKSQMTYQPSKSSFEPANAKSEVVPDDRMSIREMVEKFVKTNRPIPGAGRVTINAPEVTHDSEDLDKMRHADPVDRAAYLEFYTREYNTKKKVLDQVEETRRKQREEEQKLYLAFIAEQKAKNAAGEGGTATKTEAPKS